MTKKTIWILSPSFFDIPSYSTLRKQITSSLLDFKEVWKLQFILIDDSGGEDPEVDNIKGESDIEVITPSFNLGHQQALVLGLRSIKDQVQNDDIVVTLDSDGEDRPEDLKKLIESTLKNKSLSLARRTKRKESLKFKVLYYSFVIFFRTLTGHTIKSGNYACFYGKSLKKVIDHPFFNLCYSSSLISLKIKKDNVPCPRGDRYQGKSKMNTRSLVMHGIRMLMPFLVHIAIRSLILFTIIFAISLVGFFAILWLNVFTSHPIPSWTITLVSILFVLSFISLSNFLILFSLFTHGQTSTSKLNLYSERS